MRHYYSILKVCPNIELDDSISIGIIVLSGNSVWFKYSKTLLSRAKRFIKADTDSLESILKQISRKIKSLNESQDDNTLFLDKGVIFTESFLAHLSITHNNLLRFSTPNLILFETGDESEYEELYARLLHIPVKESKITKLISESIKQIQRNIIDPL